MSIGTKFETILARIHPIVSEPPPVSIGDRQVTCSRCRQTFHKATANNEAVSFFATSIYGTKGEEIHLTVIEEKEGGNHRIACSLL